MSIYDNDQVELEAALDGVRTFLDSFDRMATNYVQLGRVMATAAEARTADWVATCGVEEMRRTRKRQRDHDRTPPTSRSPRVPVVRFGRAVSPRRNRARSSPGTKWAARRAA